MKQQTNPTFEERLTKILSKHEKPLALREAAAYLDISVSYLYKLTHKNLIPHYKPNGKKIFFLKSELNKWLLRNRRSSLDELDQKAVDYVSLGRRDS